jgi:hypothetical protein
MALGISVPLVPRVSMPLRTPHLLSSDETSGRRVATHPAVTPTPFSTVDHIAISVVLSYKILADAPHVLQ